MQANLFYIFARMRYFILFIAIFMVVSIGAKAQGIRPNNLTMDEDTSKAAQFDKIAQSKVVSDIHAWNLVDNFSRKKTILLDTSTIGFHNYNPIFKNSISNNYLGFVGSPYENMQFFDRKKNSKFYFLQELNTYHTSTSDITYFNTTTPYAYLKYNEGSQGTKRAMQIFDAFFTQNIDSITNIGFQFDVIKNASSYALQGANHKNLSIFFSRNGTRYNAYFNFINKNNDLLNNGGITTPTINRKTGAYQLPTYFGQSLEANTKSISIFTSHEYLMGKLPFWTEKNDSVNIVFKPRYAAQYTAELNNYKRFLVEKSVPSNYFDTTYIKNSNHTDSTYFAVFNHAIQLKAFEDETRKFTFGKRVYLENELVKAVHPLAYGQRIYTYSNVMIGGEIYQENSRFWTWRAQANFTLLGRNIGDAIVKGMIEKPLVIKNDTSYLNIEGWYSDRSANIFEEHWQSNHFKWENKFKKQHEVVLRSSYNYPRFKLQAGFDYALYSNYLYNNELALPDQYKGEFSVLGAWLNKDFKFWHFGWSNKVIWQAVSNTTALRLPTLSAYSSIYFTHYLFKVMKINLGAEVFYHSAYFAHSYEPSTTRFYVQNELLTGNYPYVNLYFNAKLKRTSAFAKLEHANSQFKFGEFFGTPHYPMEQMAFRFGFLWTFYD